MNKVVDFHCHILPGVDDGSKNEEMSRAMLQASREQGVDTLVLTPHFYPDSMRLDSFLQRRANALDAIKPFSDGLRLIPGAEVAFFSGIGNAQRMEELTIASTHYLLLEMPFRQWGKRDVDDIRRLLDRGLTPIFAHIERFLSFQKDKEALYEIMDMRVIFQINAEAMLSFCTRHSLKSIMKTGFPVILGSDCHNLTSRPQNLGRGRQILAGKYGTQKLSQIDDLSYHLLKDVL